MEMMSPAHLAMELGDLSSLVQLFSEGIDLDEEYGGPTLLQHAIEVEGYTPRCDFGGRAREQRKSAH